MNMPCGCSGQQQSGPTETIFVAVPNDQDAQAREFTDRAAADAYVSAFGGGTVSPK